MTENTTLSRFKQAEYTGENRCLPCTAVNTVIGAFAAAVVGAGVTISASLLYGTLVGGSVFIASLLAIYFRGYLVPKTPELTKQYLPRWALSLFGKEPVVEDSPIVSIDPEEELLRAGALKECDDSDDLCLTESFRTDWDREIRKVRENDAGREQLLELLDVADKRVEFREHGDAFQAYVEETPVGRWESEAAYLADAGGAIALEKFHRNWATLTVEAKSDLLSGLRLFIKDCPACGGSPSFSSDSRESCCSQYEVAAVSCPDCDARLFETRV
ncbi:hypothetical protein ACFQJ7_13005 [Halovenus rubra]|uniref:Uncharacterized protein n=2 Tax=Halovenus rubra TaxID=869890 RepID=A0ACC7DZX5_9EURY|nr:hypothetical protein [Halovenus rubra]